MVTLLLSLCGSALAGDWGKAEAPAWSKTGSEVSVGKRLSVAEPVVVGDLALYPVIDRDSTGRPDSDVVPLSVAMATHQVSIREAKNGSVNQLVLVNHGDSPVMVQAGDVVHGGMQDRVLQHSALIAGGGRPVPLPVQCVERGRWSGADASFAYAGRVDPVLRDIVSRASSQDATWAAVAERNRALGVDEYGSWLEGRRIDAGQLARAESELRQRFADDKRVVGVVVARGGVFTGSEVYGDPAVFAADRLAVLGSHLATPSRRIAQAGSVPSVSDAAAYLEVALAE